MEQIPRVACKVTLLSWKSIGKDNCLGHSYSLYDLFSYHILSMSRVGENDELLLVWHEKKWGKTHSLH